MSSKPLREASSPAPRLYRIILPVGNIDRAATFYKSLLALDGMRVSPGRHYFDCGGVILAVYDAVADGDPPSPHAAVDVLYFAVPDLEIVYARARELGGLSAETGDGGHAMGQIEVRPWGERSFYMQDPFGNALCFVDDTTVFTGG
jgi:catechol 2,3-dioxygenase-like lactoylglutathione lyase family enzyme